MKPKQLIFHDDAREKIRRGVDALAEGIVPGGGVALLRARQALAGLTGRTLDETSGIRLVLRALEEPLRRIVSNGATRTYGNLLHMSVIDPAKVTRLALQNAASIASLILTTDCMIATAPKHSADELCAESGGRAPHFLTDAK
jgi:chaperonin GroEL